MVQNSKNKIGVIQGRLLPKYQGRYQAHPIDNWADEFKIANNIGLDCIEFILDFNDSEINPLMSNDGLDKILSISTKTDVTVNTICADYFMEAPLHATKSTVANKSMAVLNSLLEAAVKLQISDIVIPCVDQSSLNNATSVQQFVNQIKNVIPIIEKNGVNLSLETDLAPAPFANLLSKINSKNVTVNYDIGNSAALGYDLIAELDAYGSQITDIHIKDRLLNGGPVVLGEGNADFKLFFNNLRKFNYQGPFIMQAYRDEEGVAIFKKQLEWISPYLNSLYG